MAKRQYEVTITSEPFTVTVEASKPQGAINKAHRQWRDTIAKDVEKLDIVANRTSGVKTADVAEPANEDSEE